MKFINRIRAAARALPAVLLLMLLPAAGFAQTVIQLPVYINTNTVSDLGNGPLDVLVTTGNAWLFTSSSTGIGSTSGSSTTLTLTATAAANPPCVGCLISGAGITSGTTIAAFNGTTGITLSAAMTVAASTPLAWGVACPSYASIGGLAPAPSVALQANPSAVPLYTQARLCGLSNNGPGATVLPFAIGAH